MVEIVDKLIFDKTVSKSFTDGQLFDFTETLNIGGEALLESELIYVEKIFMDFAMDGMVIRKGANEDNTFTFTVSDVSIDFGNNFTITIHNFSIDGVSGQTGAGDPAPIVNASQTKNATVDTYLGNSLDVSDLTISGTTTNNNGPHTFDGNQDIEFNLRIALFGRKP